MGELTVNTLGALSGAALSLSFSYIPGLREWYGRLDKTAKSGLMAIIVVLTAVLLFGLSCVNSPFTAVECNSGGWWKLVEVVLFTLVTNQTAYLITPQK